MAENSGNPITWSSPKTWNPIDRDEGLPNNRPLVRRTTTVSSPDQSLRFEARDLREVKWNSVPPDGIQLGELVIDLHVYKDNTEIYDFPDGVKIEIEYTAEDAYGSDYNPTDPGDKPKLHIISGIQKPNGEYKWVQNPTDVTLRENHTGTLTTTVTNLNPDDAQWVGRP